MAHQQAVIRDPIKRIWSKHRKPLHRTNGRASPVDETNDVRLVLEPLLNPPTQIPGRIKQHATDWWMGMEKGKRHIVAARGAVLRRKNGTPALRPGQLIDTLFNRHPGPWLRRKVSQMIGINGVDRLPGDEERFLPVHQGKPIREHGQDCSLYTCVRHVSTETPTMM